MEQELAPVPKKRLTAIGKAARCKRIFARLNEGFAYDEIAREERLTARRVRQIVTDVLDRREVDGDSAHALLQLGRLGPARRAVGEVVAGGDVRAIAPLVRCSTGSTATRRPPGRSRPTTSAYARRLPTPSCSGSSNAGCGRASCKRWRRNEPRSQWRRRSRERESEKPARERKKKI